MFARFATLALFVLPALAVPTGNPPASCTTGEVMCCNKATKVSPSYDGSIMGVLSGLIGGLKVPINVQCIPAAVLGANGQSCSGQAACCLHNTVNALVSVQCDPVNIVL